jgi:hypothetical protein
MEAALALVCPTSDRELESMSLGELATTACDAHELCRGAAELALAHAIRCGDALLRAREAVKEGEWEMWVNENFPIPSMAKSYMRLAYYKDHLIEFDGAGGMRGALDYLRGLPSFVKNQRSYSDEIVQEARRLLSQGLSQREVAGLLDVPRRTVEGWGNGDFEGGRTGRPTGKARLERKRLRHRARRERAARLALRREEESKLAKKAPDQIGEAYSLIRKAAQAADRGAQETTKKEVREALNVALLRLHAAEDQVVRAVKAA